MLTNIGTNFVVLGAIGPALDHSPADSPYTSGSATATARSSRWAGWPGCTSMPVGTSEP
jgi:hypothetical protein